MSAIISSDNFEQFVPPHSIEAEMCALGSMMWGPRAVEEVLEILSPDDFYRPAHRDIFNAMTALTFNGSAVDLVTVKAELESRGMLTNVGGWDYLVQIAESVPSPSNAADYAEIVADKAMLRKLEHAGHEIVKIVHSQDMDVDAKVDSAEQMVFSVAAKKNKESLKPVMTVAKEFFIQVDALYETGQPVLGTQSGFYDLDKMTGGLYGGELSIVGARPSMGKTAFILSFALNIAKAQKGAVAIFSLEMGASQLVRRMLSMLSGVGMGILKQPDLGDDSYHKLADACESLYSLPIFIDDNSDVSPMEMRGRCRRLKAEHGLGLVMVDYLQLMKAGRRTENRVQEISEIARSLKALSKELECPIVALSQLNRGVEARDDKRPQLSDIRESGSIEAEADVVMFLYRDEYYKKKEAPNVDEPWDPDKVEEAEIIIAKHRNGPTGKVIMGFQPNYARFVNLKR